jgi:hypothetical protein
LSWKFNYLIFKFIGNRPDVAYLQTQYIIRYADNRVCKYITSVQSPLNTWKLKQSFLKLILILYATVFISLTWYHYVLIGPALYNKMQGDLVKIQENERFFFHLYIIKFTFTNLPPFMTIICIRFQKDV